MVMTEQHKMVIFNGIEGKDGKAVKFTSTGSAHVNCGTFNPSEGTGQLTFSFWVNYAGNTGNYMGIVCKRDNYAAGEVMWNIETSNAAVGAAGAPLNVSYVAAGTPRIYSSYTPPVGNGIW